MYTDRLARLAVTAITRRDLREAELISSPDYQEHSALAAPRRARSASFADLVAALPDDFHYEPLITFGDGWHLVLLGLCTGLGDSPLHAVDVFRIREGLLCEHWDATGRLADAPAGPASAHPYTASRPDPVARGRDVLDAPLRTHPGTTVPDPVADRLGTPRTAAASARTGHDELTLLVVDGELAPAQVRRAGAAGSPLDHELFRHAAGAPAGHWTLSCPDPSRTVREDLADAPRLTGLHPDPAAPARPRR